MADKSSPLVSKIIKMLLTNKKLQANEKVSYMVWIDKNKGVSLSTVDYEKDQVITYPMGWKTAAFVGYCLIQEALQSAGEETVDYLMQLTERRGDIINLMKEFSELFSHKED